MNVIGYPTPGKDKARVILEAFCTGAGGSVGGTIPAALPPGAVPAFYGVTPATAHLWRQARAEGRSWYYIDNAYFDKVRGKYFRVTQNRLQHDGRGESDGRRFAALNVTIQPWRHEGRHVLVCPQSAEFMRVCAEYPGEWLSDALALLRTVTDRDLRVRPWQRDKTKWYETLGEDLKDCWMLATYSSASAITAMLAGVPAICTAEDCISRAITGSSVPWHSPARAAWAAVVADNQWTLDEMREGLAWEMLNAREPTWGMATN